MHTDPNYVLVMRTCNADMTSYGGFMWPRSGMVECPNWDPRPVCGYGLHGFLWGEGDGGLASWDPDAVWMIVKVLAADLVILDNNDKVKFPRGEVILCGDRLAVTQYMMEHAPGSRAIIGLMATGGYRSTLTGGYRSTLTGGDGSTLTGGHYSTLTGGDGSTLTIKHWDGKRCRLVTAYVGEDGILPNVPYRLDENGKFVRA